MRILLVDDDDIVLEMMSDTLELAGYEVEQARDGGEAWRRLLTAQIDLVITDWEMPVMNGIDLCRRVRQELSRYTYVVLVTGRDQAEDAVHALNAGADEFIPKPVSPMELRARVSSIQRLKELNGRVLEQNRQLKRAQELKEDWINMLVHDLRSPLTVIQGSCELLERTFSSKGAARLRVIQREASRIHDMAEQMLITAKSDEGRLVISREPKDLTQLLKDAGASAGAIAASRGTDLNLHGVDQSVVTQVDESLLRRLLDNLISNAIKFAPQGSEVRVHLRTEDATVLLDVEDEGPGIPEADHLRIFDKFEIVDAGHANAAQFGLGLAFCRSVAEAHEGSIEYVPREPRGSIFRVHLPLVTAAATS